MSVTFGQTKYQIDYHKVDSDMRFISPPFTKTFESPADIATRLITMIPSKIRPEITQKGGAIAMLAPVPGSLIAPNGFHGYFPGMPLRIKKKDTKRHRINQAAQQAVLINTIQMHHELSDPNVLIRKMLYMSASRDVWGETTDEWCKYTFTLSPVSVLDLDLLETRIINFIKLVFRRWVGTFNHNTGSNGYIKYTDAIKEVTVNDSTTGEVSITFNSFIYRLIFDYIINHLCTLSESERLQETAPSEKELCKSSRWAMFGIKNKNSDQFGNLISTFPFLPFMMRQKGKTPSPDKPDQEKINELFKNTKTELLNKSTLGGGGEQVGADAAALSVLEAMYMQNHTSQIYADILQVASSADPMVVSQSLGYLLPAYANSYVIAEQCTRKAARLS